MPSPSTIVSDASVMHHSNRCPACRGDALSRSFEKKGYAIMRCRGCGLVFTALPEGFDPGSVYDASYFTGGQEDGYGDYAATKDILHREFARDVALLRRITGDRPGLRLLEVGSAHGFFLDMARGHFACQGIEISASAAAAARERGHVVHDGVVCRETLEAVGRVDVIVLLDTIEHLPDPFTDVSMLDAVLEPGGIMLTVTGDVDSLHARLAGRHWRLMTPPQHVTFFSRDTLERLFSGLGHDILVSDRPWKLVPLELILHQLRRLGIRLKRGGRGAGVPVNLFDTIRIISRKPTAEETH